MAPEVVLGKGYGKAVDWWSFGVLAFELTAGFAPFAARHHKEIYENITKGKYTCPEYFSNQAKDLVRNLLQIDLSRR